MRQRRSGERRDVRDRAARRIGLVFPHNLEALLAAVVSAQGDRHAKGSLARVLRWFHDLRAGAPGPPVADFPQAGRGRLQVAFLRGHTVLRFETVESGLDGGQTRFGHEIAVRRDRAVGKSVRVALGFLDERAAHGRPTGVAPTSFRLERVNSFRRFGLCQVGCEGARLTAFFRQGFEIGGLRSGHRVVPGDPVVRRFLRIGVRRGVDLWVHFVLGLSPRCHFACHRTDPAHVHGMFEWINASGPARVPPVASKGTRSRREGSLTSDDRSLAAGATILRPKPTAARAPFA